MGRPPCCDKVGIKKGPWTPEEDIILVSYIQEHGPGNWRSVPTNTGLLRCSKSCRLRWTNYLRPGIKRGNFTPHEEGMIIHLQALLGNKWAAIASYLPQRTDNDIKNYWNTHLKKKLKKLHTALDPHNMALSTDDRKSRSMDSDLFSGAAPAAVPTAATYASSTENISRLLEGWMRSSPNNVKTKAEQDGGEFIPHEELDSMLSFENLNNVAWDKSTCDSGSGNEEVEMKQHVSHDSEIPRKQRLSAADSSGSAPQLSVFEKWLLDESNGHVVEEMMELSPIF